MKKHCLCGRIREKSNAWKGGNPNCIDCGTILTRRDAKRCRCCENKTRTGKNHPMYGVDRKGSKCPRWKGGISSKPEYHRERSRRLYATNPEFRLKRLANNLKRMNLGYISGKIIQLIYEDNIKKYGTLTCYLCLKQIPFGKDNLEHKIPLSRGGTNEYNNLAIACQSCNRKKHSKTEEEFRVSIYTGRNQTPSFKEPVWHRV